MLPDNQKRLNELLDIGCEKYQEHHPEAFDVYSELMAKKGQWEAARWRCQTDLWLLALVLNYSLIVESCHRRIAEFFVKKDPRKGIFEQDRMKRRLLLYPRLCFKSTFNMVDTIQWLLCFPQIVTFILCAAGDLADAFVEEVANHFVKAKDEEPTLFQELFPELTITPREKRVGQFTLPTRKDFCKKHRLNIPKEPSVLGLSAEQSLSGKHCHVFKPDDMVDNRNSGTATGLKKVKKNYHLNRKMLWPAGYLDLTGTRYSPLDPYGEAIEKAKPGSLKFLLEPAYRAKSGHEDKTFEELTENDVELLFAYDAAGNPQLTFEKLKEEYDEDPESFATQLMNDARAGREDLFSKERLLQATVSASALPVSGTAIVAWRLSHPSKVSMKYACGVAGILDSGRMWITDVIRGQFSPSNLAHRIVQFAKKHGAHNVRIEETPGARYNEDAISNYALLSNWPISVEWLEYQEDDGTRDLRVKQLETVLVSKRLLFSDAIIQPSFKALFSEFSNFGFMEENEIPDTVSRVCEGLPKSLAAAESEEQDDAVELLQKRDLHDRLFHKGKYAEEDTPAPVVDHQRQSYFGLPDVLGGLNG